MIFYHVISDRPKMLHQYFVADTDYRNGIEMIYL